MQRVKLRNVQTLEYFKKTLSWKYLLRYISTFKTQSKHLRWKFLRKQVMVK